MAAIFFVMVSVIGIALRVVLYKSEFLHFLYQYPHFQSTQNSIVEVYEAI
jgi:hypothetical protein